MLGVPTKVWKNCPPNLPTILELSRAHGEKTFLVYEDERTSFEEHFRQAATFARRLVERYGVVKGDRVAIAMRNFPEWVVSFWAASAAGAIVVPLNAWWTAPELVYGITDSGAKVLITDGERYARLEDDLGDLGLAGVIVARPDTPLSGSAEDFAEVLGDVRADVTLPEVDVQPDDDATIFYTSGTTGQPKGALGTHRNICTGVMASRTRWSPRRPDPVGDVPDLATLADRPQECTLLNVPLFHVTGCHGVCSGSTGFGAKLVMMHKWDPDRALELIERETDHHLRRRPVDGVASARVAGFSSATSRASRPSARRGAGATRAGEPDRGDVPRADAIQRLGHDRDIAPVPRPTRVRTTCANRTVSAVLSRCVRSRSSGRRVRTYRPGAR